MVLEKKPEFPANCIRANGIRIVRGKGDAGMVSERMRLSLRSYPGREDAHVHDFHQAVLPIAGALDIQVGGADGSVSGHQGVMITRGARHVFRGHGSNCFIVLDLLPDALPPMALRSPFFGLDQTFSELARYAGNELRASGLGDAEHFHLAALIAGKVRQCCTVPPRWSASVERALAVLRERHAERLTMAEVARAAGLGVSRLHEVFRRETGRTPAEMLAEIRLDCAEELLTRTRLPIAEIALRVGYSEQSALTRSLRRRRGTTPHAFRRCPA
jgi:AraC-like DNA-binding protein